MSWIPVTERLPEDGQTVLIWCNAVDMAQFRASSLVWLSTAYEKMYAEHLVDYSWMTPAEIEEDIEYTFPRGPHFRGGGGDCTTIWTAAKSFACRDEEGYGAAPPITHWMPLPAPPPPAPPAPFDWVAWSTDCRVLLAKVHELFAQAGV